MKTFVFISIFFLISTFESKGFAEIGSKTTIDSIDFDAKIKLIHEKIVDLTDIFVLHSVKEFNEVYYSPLKYQQSVLQYLQTSTGFENKLIAVCSMTQLPLNDYNNLLETYFKLYQEGKIDERLLARCIFNEFDVHHRFIKEYENVKVKKLLSKMIAYKTLSKQFRIDLKETLSGKMYYDLKRTGHL